MIAASAPLYERLARGVKALVAAFRSVAPDEQIHQCVRAVEALLTPEAWGAAAFVEHATRFVAATADRGAILDDFYQLRNAVEHLRGLDNRALPNVLPPDRPAVAMRHPGRDAIVPTRCPSSFRRRTDGAIAGIGRTLIGVHPAFEMDETDRLSWPVPRSGEGIIRNRRTMAEYAVRHRLTRKRCRRRRSVRRRAHADRRE
jgi:hypothetical protein